MGLNPYPPPTLPPTLGSPTATYTAAVTLPPTWTPTISNTPSVTDTAVATETPSPPPEPEVTDTPVAQMPFALQVGSPARMPNFVNEDECNWFGIYGQVFDLTNSPIIDLVVRLAGEYPGVGSLDLTALTGSAPDLGPGAYLFNVSNTPAESDETLWIQLEDGSGGALSEQIFLETTSSCEENLIMVNFRQVLE
jgi:hypothetical protein